MFQPLSHLDYFRTLVEDTGQIPLLEAAASIALDAYPKVDLQGVLSDIDRLCRELAERCRDHSTDLKRLQQAVAFFFGEMRFAGNVEHYYEPDNSYIHKVLERRRGIPISLATVFIELARYVGLDAHGVSFPGHFLVRVNLHDGPVVLDPFSGRSLSLDALRNRLTVIQTAEHRPIDNDAMVAGFLTAASPVEILLRLLRNLREIHRQQGQTALLAQVIERMRILDPET